LREEPLQDAELIKDVLPEHPEYAEDPVTASEDFFDCYAGASSGFTTPIDRVQVFEKRTGPDRNSRVSYPLSHFAI